jgi:menaquinone-dependent protoporphyrinogen oxidase
MRILILYASEHGQTEAVAAALATHLERAGHNVYVFDSRLHQPPPDDYDAVLIGTRIQIERPARRILRYVRDHRAALDAMPTACFTVSMSAVAGHDREGARICMDRFLRATGWRPRWRAIFGGGLPYRRYGRALRWLMRRIAATMNAPVDTRRNHDLTDWDEVARFAAQIAADLNATEPARASVTPIADGVAAPRTA